MHNQIKREYEAAKDRYANHGINTDEVLEKLKKIKISMHCWQIGRAHV